MTQPTIPPPPASPPKRANAIQTLLFAAIGLLVILTVISVVTMVSTLSFNGQVKDSNCIYLKYTYDDDEEEDTENSFSELDPQERALADLYDCDIDGR